MLLDEPFAGIDPIAVADIQKIIFHLQGPRHRRAGHRPQRPRDAQNHRSRLHRARWRDFPQRHARSPWPPTRTSSGFTSVPISGWTKIEGRAHQVSNGDSTETSRAARSEAHSDAVTAAGDQAAADDDARAGGAAQSGDGREPDARGGSDRGRADAGGARRRRKRRSRRRRTTARTTWDDADYEYFFGEYLDEGYRPRQPQEVKELPPIENTLSTKSSLADHLMWQLNLQTTDDDAARHRRGDHRQHRRGRLPGGVGQRDRGARATGTSRRREGARARAVVRPDRRRRARPAGMPAAADPPPRPGRHAGRGARPRSPAPAAEPPDSGARARARHRARRDQGAHRGHQAPRSEAGRALQPGRFAVRHSGRLHHQDRRRAIARC